MGQLGVEYSRADGGRLVIWNPDDRCARPFCSHPRSSHGVTQNDTICREGARIHHATRQSARISFGCGCPEFKEEPTDEHY
jgi:hypothetical protein